MNLQTRRIVVKNLRNFLGASGSHFRRMRSGKVLLRTISTLIFSMTFITLIASLFLLIRMRIRKKEIGNRFILVFSLTSQQIENGEESQGVIEFLEEERFGLEIEDSVVLIEDKSLKGVLTRDSRVVPSIWIAMLWKYSDKSDKRTFFQMAIQALESIIKTDYHYKSNPMLAAYSLAEYSYWSSVQNKKIQCVTTQSSMSKLPTPFILQDAGTNLHMFWYSANSTPIVGLESRQQPYLLNNELAKNDICHHVWDESSKCFLNSQGIKNIRIQGPILFIPRRKIPVNLGERPVVYFDVTPIAGVENYYSEERMIANIRTICEIRRQLKIEENINFQLFLKPKRKFSRNHSSEYIKVLRELENSGDVVILNENLNLYGLLEKTIFALGVPFTSPVLLAKEMHVIAGYIDFGKKDFRLPKFHENVELLTSSSSLKTRLISVL